MHSPIHLQVGVAEQTAFFFSILEGSTEYAIVAKDLDGTILSWNEGARRNYGYSTEEMVGKANSRVLHAPEDLASGRVDVALQSALSTGKFEGEFQRVRKDGVRFMAQVAITLRRDERGQPIGFVLISKDITAQKVLEQQLRRKNEELEQQNQRAEHANRLKSEFLANMSHELRTPLNGIIGFAELMHSGKAGPISVMHREYLGDVLVSARHLLRLINDVLDLAKVESGKLEFRVGEVDLEKVVSEVRDVLRAVMSKKRMKVETEVDPSIDLIRSDAAKLKQVLYNYLSNALKFTPEEGRIQVRVLPEGDEDFRLEVVDTVIGIQPEDRDRLFVEFQQLNGTPTQRAGGTGLGLAVTKRIAEAQGGRVGVQSSPGSGSTFYAVLPRQLVVSGGG